MSQNYSYIEKSYLLELFENAPVPHGQSFDHGLRWCGNCMKSSITGSDNVDNPWTTKACAFCVTVWPEYVHEYVDHITDEGLLEDTFIVEH